MTKLRLKTIPRSGRSGDFKASITKDKTILFGTKCVREGLVAKGESYEFARTEALSDKNLYLIQNKSYDSSNMMKANNSSLAISLFKFDQAFKYYKIY